MRLFSLLFVLTLVQCTSSQKLLSPEVMDAAKQITDATLRSHIKTLSSDAYEGRGTGEKGDALAVKYIEGVVKSMGLAPGMPGGSFTQRVPLVGVKSHAPPELTVKNGNKMLTLKHNDDTMLTSGNLEDKTEIKDAEIVFVGYGIVAPEFQWDDFKDVDVKGKVLLVMNYNPTSFAGKRRLWYGRWDYKYLQAAQKGAAGVIIIHTTPSAAYPWQVVQTSWAGEKFELADNKDPKVQMRGWATEEACKKIAALSGNDLDKLRETAESPNFKPVGLGTHFSILIHSDVRRAEAENVVAVLEGSDKALKQEGVIYSAHHDHLGVKDGKIYHGAIDNASGVSALLNIAAAFKALKTPPKRSVYFVFTAAEEGGLLGSEYFAQNPPLLRGRISANINIDGIGVIGRTKDIRVSGFGKTSLDALLTAIAKEQGKVVKGEEFPEEGMYYRSDQFSFAKIGVPAVFLGSGVDVVGKPEGYGRKLVEEFTARDYHQPSDVYHEEWIMDGAIEDATLAFALGVAVANAPTLALWTPKDEFEATRLAALREVANVR